MDTIKIDTKSQMLCSPPSPGTRATAAGWEAAGVSEAGVQPSRGSPSIPPPNSMLEVSTSSATSTEDDDEEVVEQPSHAPEPQVLPFMVRLISVYRTED